MEPCDAGTARAGAASLGSEQAQAHMRMCEAERTMTVAMFAKLDLTVDVGCSA